MIQIQVHQLQSHTGGMNEEKFRANIHADLQWVGNVVVMSRMMCHCFSGY